MNEIFADKSKNTITYTSKVLCTDVPKAMKKKFK